METGQWLSKVVHCPIHWPAYGKNLFECKHGVVFPKFFLDGHTEEEIVSFHLSQIQERASWTSGLQGVERQ